MAETPVLGGPTLLTAASQTIYTAPATGYCIIRAIHAVNDSDSVGSPVDAKLTVGIGATNVDGQGKRIVPIRFIPCNREYDWLGFKVLPANWVLYALADKTNALTIDVSVVTGP